MLVKTAARPTTECNAATIWGSSMAVMRLPMTVPIVPPMADTAANWISTSGENPTAASDAKMPEPTPKIPRIFPWRAVACEASPDIEPTKCWCLVYAGVVVKDITY